MTGAQWTEQAQVRTARFAGVIHRMATLTGPADSVGALIADQLTTSDSAALQLTVHAADAGALRSALRSLTDTKVECAVDGLIQPPVHGECAMVLWSVSGDGTVTYPAPGVSQLSYRGGSLVRVGHATAPTGWQQGFDDLLARLAPYGLGLADIWKTWSFLPAEPGDLELSAAAFRDFNLVRAGVFGDTRFHLDLPSGVDAGYPANTGVGDFAGPPTLTGLAGRTAGEVRALAVENRRQLPPYRYGTGTGRPRPAQFSRAVMLAEGDQGLVFVAGTAAVVDSHTTGSTVTEQLHVTLDLVDGLLSGDAVAGAGLRLTGGLDALLSLTVYVASPQHLDVVRDELARRLAVPVVCVLSPLTRPDLLVEVDGTAVVGISSAVDGIGGSAVDGVRGEAQ